MRRYQTVKNAFTSRLIERFIIHCTIPTNAQYIKVLYATSTMGLSLLTLYKKLNRVSTHIHVLFQLAGFESPPKSVGGHRHQLTLLH